MQPNPCDMSFAHVKANRGWIEDWTAPAFDEYTLVLKGSVIIEHSHGPPVVVVAGQALFLAKGERVRWVFTEPAEHIPICLPAFCPAHCFREAGRFTPAAHDAHTEIYHIVQSKVWEHCKATGATYYPPTYDQDGFTHATADPTKLLMVANYLCQDMQVDWLCLKITRTALSDAGITLKFEDPSPAGSKNALPWDKWDIGGERYPHIYGGIPSQGVVAQEYTLRRGAGGEYLSIEGLCEVAPSPKRKSTPIKWALYRLSNYSVGTVLAGLLPSPSAALFVGGVGVAVGFALAKTRPGCRQ